MRLSESRNEPAEAARWSTTEPSDNDGDREIGKPSEFAGIPAVARELDVKHPDAAASPREGLEEICIVAGLGVTGRLRRSLTNTNCIESMISITHTTTGRRQDILICFARRRV